MVSLNLRGSFDFGGEWYRVRCSSFVEQTRVSDPGIGV